VWEAQCGGRRTRACERTRSINGGSWSESIGPNHEMKLPKPSIVTISSPSLPFSTGVVVNVRDVRLAK
jgi:hypothetical protein